ncbi:hypothetical protein BCR41DRAFT_187280 [Lobosporangium transversale]|uniref:Uncharacterized protein n=1 Tax=Lobosporangium transversale TaxID=64571 RepID=A0A1Y2GA47_9FUNG|nr:hypothetical protein BCR41DRAFT_187280 [Lobosporangium transversale]ORZ05304.1 hypothetical protein BCR41DRAFT_187280 [Lobosporangium transversale]|eukprot:XP_021876996.1 hypothetical protein BCR41DRAFT_187280 [Lobosporangium transversale]
MANQAKIKDDDDLPSLDDVMNQISFPAEPPSTKVSARKSSKNQPLTALTTFLPDSSLAIPGELVLAWSDRFYYPGRIIDYASGHSKSIERKKFFTRYEKGFQTCQKTTKTRSWNLRCVICILVFIGLLLVYQMRAVDCDHFYKEGRQKEL